MAKRKPNRRPLQAQHAPKLGRSRHDRRKRLDKSNPHRVPTRAAWVPLIGTFAGIAMSMARLLDVRSGFRLPIILAGAVLASGRRTASSWFRAAGVKDDWDRFYELLRAVGKSTAAVMQPVAQVIVRRFDPGEGGYWTLALDDSPTRRHGPHVEAANIHHNPTPGPADGPWLYGHCWVCLAIVLRHWRFGVFALPLLSRLYVRMIDVKALKAKYQWKFRTKHQLARELVVQVVQCLRALGSKAGIVVVFDGAYAAGDFVRQLLKHQITVVTRLRSDAKLFDLPGPRTCRRGRPRTYGKNRLSLKKRAGRRDGWQSSTYFCRGVEVTGRYKTFLATSQVFGRVIRVVLLRHANGSWAAYASSDVNMTAEQILRIVSDRWAIEEYFHDVKEIWGAGEQQVRNLWSNIGCWHICGWLYSLVELECWDLEAEELVDRRNRPWDNPNRRPSHADKRRYIARKMLRNQFLSDLPRHFENTKIRDHFETLLALAI